MINSFFPEKEEKIISPGIVIYENVLNFNIEDIDLIVSLHNFILNNVEKYRSLNIKNVFFHELNKINKKEFAENIQKTILHYFAKYCDIYPETIHTIQWQENIFIDIDYSGNKPFIFNTNKSEIDDNNNIKNIPFSRQVVMEVIVDDNFEGGSMDWLYLNNVTIDKLPRGSILIYPANYLFSKKHNTIINGRKVSLTTFFNGGKDFLAENSDSEENNFLFSYMR